MRWHLEPDNPEAPPAVVGHTMTVAGERGIYVFGGQGKKASAALHRLDPTTRAWHAVSVAKVTRLLLLPQWLHGIAKLEGNAIDKAERIQCKKYDVHRVKRQSNTI